MSQQIPLPTDAPQACDVTFVLRDVKLVAHTLPPVQSAVVVQKSPWLHEVPESAHAVPPSARVKQKSQVPGHTSAQVAHVPAALQAWMGSQQVPLQQTFGAVQPVPAWP